MGLNESMKDLVMMGGFIMVLSDGIKFGGERSNYDLTNANAADFLGMVVGYAYSNDKSLICLVQD